MKPTLMIHEVREEMFKLPLEDYTLTFDDGLYSQYYYFDRFKALKTQKIYFISSDIVCTNQTQSRAFTACAEAHAKAFAGNKEDFMTLAQIQELMQDPNVTIGAHGHLHKNLDSIPKLIHKVEHIKQDTELMLEWFWDKLRIKPTAFCFPYNNDLDGMYRGLLKSYGFTEFYGRERIPIEKLLHDENQLGNLDTLTAWSLPRYF